MHYFSNMRSSLQLPLHLLIVILMFACMWVIFLCIYLGIVEKKVPDRVHFKLVSNPLIDQKD